VGFLRRKRQVRLVALAVVLLGALVSVIVLSDATEAYVPGERTEGLTDSLARSLPSDLPRLALRDVTAAAGIDFRHFPATRTNRLPEDMGSGVALGDVDGDGWADVYLVDVAGTLDTLGGGRTSAAADGGGRCRLFRNRGDGTFEDVTDASGTGLRVMGMAALFVDVDGDSDLDLLVSAYGECQLLVNDGTGHFEDRSDAAGVSGHDGFWAGMASGDYDLDGDVDVYVTGYVRYVEELGVADDVARQYGTDIPALINPSTFEPEANRLLRNRGDGTFEDAAVEAGVDDPRGRGLGALFADFSGDGLPDLYVANDVSDNVLFLNRGDGTFEDVTAKALVGDYRGAMGLAASDFDGDLDLDLFITHWVAQENALYVNITSDLAADGKAPTVMFIDEADRWGLGQVALHMVGWATRFFDLDNDGLRDLFVVNGSTIPRKDAVTRLTPMRTHLFWSGGADRGFFEVGPVAGPFFEREVVGRGGATFDYDLDGDEDLLITLHGEAPVLLSNESETGHALRVRLRQPRGNTHALGAWVTVVAGDGTQTDQIGTQGSYLSQHVVGEVAFGLGDAEQVDRLEVVWPDGERESGGPFPADRLVTWTRGTGPQAQALPGRAPRARKPESVDEQRRFYAVQHEAAEARVAGDLELAVDRYAEALDLWPGHADCLYYLANSLAELGREAEALAVFEDMVALHPRASRAWMQLGRLRLPGGDPALDDVAAAEAAFLHAHGINGEETGPVIQLGVTALLRGDEDRADEWLADAATTDARSVEARWFRGLIAWRRGDVERAATLLEQARSIAAGVAAKDESVSSEGDTATGAAMLAPDGTSEGADVLGRWTTLLDRPGDAEGEFAGVRLP